MEASPRDQNHIPALILESSTNPGVVISAKGDEITGRLLVDVAAGGGTVTSVSVVTANGVSGSVATATTTPAITLTLGAITPSSITLGTGSITMTGSIAATGARVTKGWFTDVESTNMYTVGGTSLASTFSPIAGSASIVTVGTITSGAWNGTDIPVTAGGTGVSAISALSVWVANSANTITEVTPGAGNSIRVNGAGNAWEAFTPSASVPTAITVADEATDATCFLGFFTAATGDLGPKSNANLTFNSSTGVATFGQTIVGSISGNAGTASAVAVGGITGLGTNVATALAVNVGSAGAFVVNGGALGTPSSGTVTNLTGTASININGTVGATTPTTGVFTTATVNTGLMPDANDGAYLGQAGTAFSDLFLAEGGIINWDSGDATITQTGNVLAVAGADFRVATAGVGTDADSVPTLSSTSTLTNKTLTSPTLTTPSAFTTGGTITLAENTSIALDPAGSADGKYTGITISGTAGATLAFGDLCYLSSADSRWELADADAATTADRMMGMCVLAAAGDGSATTMLLMGQIRADAAFPALTIGSAVYVGETAGDIQVAIPTGADNVIRRVGYALTADEIYFNPSMDSQITVA